MPMTPHDAFISYSTLDRDTAETVCRLLEQQGLRCWMAPRDIEPGEEWPAAIIRAIGASKTLVLVLTEHSNASPQIRNEVERAVSRGVRVIPFRVEDVQPSDGLSYFLGSRHWLDALTRPLEPHTERLARTILSTRDGNDGAPPPPPVPAPGLKGLATGRWTRFARFAWMLPAIAVFGNLMARLSALAPENRLLPGSASLLDGWAFLDISAYLIGAYGMYLGRAWGAWIVLIVLGANLAGTVGTAGPGLLGWSLLVGAGSVLVILVQRARIGWVKFPARPAVANGVLGGLGLLAILQLVAVLRDGPSPAGPAFASNDRDSATAASAYQLLIANRLDEAAAAATSVPATAGAAGRAKAVLANIEIERYTQTKDTAAARRSVTHLAEAERQAPGDVLTLVARGTFDLAVRGDTTAARRHFENAVAADSTNAYARNQLGFVLLLFRQYEPAARELRRAIALAPEMAWAYTNLSVALLGQRACPDAAENAKRVAGQEQASVQAMIGHCFLEARDFAAAAVHYQNAVAITPTNGTLRGYLAAALFRAGRRDQAMVEARRAKADGLVTHWVLDSLGIR